MHSLSALVVPSQLVFLMAQLGEKVKSLHFVRNCLILRFHLVLFADCVY